MFGGNDLPHEKTRVLDRHLGRTAQAGVSAVSDAHERALKGLTAVQQPQFTGDGHAKGLFTGAFKIQHLDTYYLLRFAERHVMNPMQVEYLGRDMGKIIARAERPKIVIDFRGVHSICSSVLGVLVTTQRSCRASEGELRAATLRRSLKELFHVTYLHKVIPLYPTVEAATRRF